MSAETFKILNLQEKDLDRSNIPQVVGAEGTSLGAIGRIECELKIGKETCKQKFLVCQNLRRHLILGVDSAKTYAAGVHWTKHNSFVLTIDGVKVAETTEKHQLPSVSLKSRVKIPPRHCAIIDVDINTDSKDKIRITGDDYCLNQNPNMYIDPISADLSQRTDESVCPLAVVNLSSDQYIEMPKNHVLAFAKKDEVEVESCFDIEEDPDPSPRNWIPRQPRRPAGTIAEMMSGIPRTFTGLQKLFTGDERQSVQPVAEVDVVKTETDLHQILTSASNFIKSPAEVETHRKVDLDDAATSEETKVKFTKLCGDFQDIVSQGSTDIGKTLLVEMDIETGDSPPIASRPYTLPLKHYDWVRKEITQLERADIITKSISPWASPVVIVPKKTIPGAPPERENVCRLQETKRSTTEGPKHIGRKRLYISSTTAKNRRTLCKTQRPAHLSQKPKPTVLLGALVHWLMRNNLLKKKDGYSIEQCSNDFSCSKTILKRVISGKKQKGGREYKREAEARERSDAPPTEEE